MGMSEAKAQHRNKQKHKLMHTVLMLAVSGLCLFMIADLWPGLMYDLSSKKLRDLGRAEGLDIKSLKIPEDSFVQIKGITGTRGATVKGSQASSWLMPERWFRQLVGSAIILEAKVGQDKKLRDRFSMFSELTVKGRLRYIHKNSDYANVISFFKQHYHYDVPAYAVVITVNRVPGGSYKSLLAVLALLAVLLINIGTFFFVMRRKVVVNANQPETDKA